MNNQSSNAAVVSQLSKTDDEIDIGQLLTSVYRGFWLVILITLLALTLSIIYASALDSRFRSSTKIYVDGVSSADAALPGFSGFDISTPDDKVLNSEIEVLRSSSIISRIVQNLDLDKDPEFNSALREQSRISIISSTIIEFFRGPPIQISEAEQRNKERQQVIEKILNDLQVRVIPQTFVLEISFEALSPQRAEEVVQEFANTYVISRSETESASYEKSLELLQERLPKLSDDVTRIENELISFEADGGVITPQSLAMANAQLAQQLEQISNLEEHNDVVTELELDRLRSTSQALKQRIELQSARHSKYVALQQELAISNEIYQSYLVRLREVSLETASIDSDVRVIQEAEAPTVPFAPRRFLIVALGTFFGFLIGAIAALAYAFFLAPFQESSELTQATGKNVFALVPEIRGKISVNSILKRSFERKTEMELVSAMQDVASLIRSTIEPAPKVISLTSTVPGEGKTTTSLMLSQLLATAGEKVLLVDADLHRTTLSKDIAAVTGSTFEVGLAQILEGAAEFNSNIVHELGANHHYLCAGMQSQASSRLLSSREFRRIIEVFTSSYDIVVFDCPPVIANSDSIIVGNASDVSLYIVRAKKASKSAVVRNIHRFDERLSKPMEILFCGKAKNDRYGYNQYN